MKKTKARSYGHFARMRQKAVKQLKHDGRLTASVFQTDYLRQLAEQLTKLHGALDDLCGERTKPSLFPTGLEFAASDIRIAITLLYLLISPTGDYDCFENSFIY